MIRRELEEILKDTNIVVSDRQGLLIAYDPKISRDEAMEIAAYLPFVGFEVCGLYFSRCEKDVAYAVLEVLA